ncbi:hypothetical protein ScPMuIL_004129 [Solemya velum]
MQDLRRTTSWKPKKESVHGVLARSNSEDVNDPNKRYLRRYIGMPLLPPMRPRSAWNFEDDTDSTTSSDTMMTTNSDEAAGPRTPTQLYYTTPPKTNMVRNQDFEKTGDGKSIRIFTADMDPVYGDGSHSLPPSPSASSALIKSMNGNTSPGSLIPKQPITTPKKRISSSDSENTSPSKFDKRKNSERERKFTYDLSFLFESVEQQDLDLVKAILESETLPINSVNDEGLTLLDVAVMTNNIPMAKMLLLHGAKESPLFQKENCRSSKLDMLVSSAEKKVVDLTAVVLNSSSGVNTTSVTQLKENERRLVHWEFRHRLLKRMKAGYDHARTPDAPTNATLIVASSSSLLVRFDEPLNHNGAVVTKYQVQWSCFEDFIPLAGEDCVEDVRHLEFEITGLIKGNSYYVRVTAWNMKGYGPYATANPPYAVPSSWRDIDNSQQRTEGKLQCLEDLFVKVKHSRPADAPELKDNTGSESPLQRKRKSIKNLFTSAPKFTKYLKRGVYLACLLYNEDKILVTSEEQLPVVEVDENFSGPSVHVDFHWLMKIACTWDDVKSLRQDMDRSSSAGTTHFRSKLLQAATLLQNALGMQDLGQFYYKPLRDYSGSMIFMSVNYIRDPKLVGLGSAKWVTVSKLQRRRSATTTENSLETPDFLVNCTSELILYHQVSGIRLPRGLYLGYLKLHSSVDLIRLLVPHKTPNVFPNVKVRDCPNVSREEWEWLQTMNADDHAAPPTNTQLEFQKVLATAAQRLFTVLGIPENFTSEHRLYDLEVIDLSPDVSFILVLPPVENVCIVPGQSDGLLSKQEFMLLPVQVFEMIHLGTYQPQIVSRYARISSILEMDLTLAQQAQREAFSSSELSSAKKRVEVLNSLQQSLDKSWKSMRWIMDIITYARDKNVRGGIPILSIVAPSDGNTTESVQSMKVPDNNNSFSCTSVACNSNEIRVGKDHQKMAKFYDPTEEYSNSNGHVTHKDANSVQGNLSGILRVYAAYETGLAKGTSVRLHVTSKTTAREVINLVVRQLNKAVITRTKSTPTYLDEQLDNFCLVAVIGVRERILRDDYQPLKLQNPWTNGRLYVRLKNTLLAAIQQGHATTV